MYYVSVPTSSLCRFSLTFSVHTCVLLVIHTQCFPLTIRWFICFALVYLHLLPDSSCHFWFVLGLISPVFFPFVATILGSGFEKKRKKKKSRN